MFKIWFKYVKIKEKYPVLEYPDILNNIYCYSKKENYSKTMIIYEISVEKDNDFSKMLSCNISDY